MADAGWRAPHSDPERSATKDPGFSAEQTRSLGFRTLDSDPEKVASPNVRRYLRFLVLLLRIVAEANVCHMAHRSGA